MLIVRTPDWFWTATKCFFHWIMAIAFCRFINNINTRLNLPMNFTNTFNWKYSSLLSAHWGKILWFWRRRGRSRRQVRPTPTVPTSSVGSPRPFGQSPMEVDHAHGGIYPDAIPAQLIALKWLILYKEKCKEYIES